MDSDKYAHCLPPSPVRHRRKEPFSPRVQAPDSVRERLQQIHRLDHELERFVLNEQDYLELVSEAWARNFHASTVLEGNPLALEEVRATTRRAMQGEAEEDLDPHRQEIVQHVLSWSGAHRLQMPWTLRAVCDLHGLLMQNQHEEETRPGVLRDDPERAPVGRRRQTPDFEGAPGTHVEHELTELLRWINQEAPVIDPLVAAAVFFHEFESIHPFYDGNGRTGRVLLHVFLEKNGLPNLHKCFLEEKVTKRPDLYYRILAWADHTGSYRELIDYFLDATLEAYEDAVQRFRSKDLLATNVDENRRRLLVEAKRHGGWFSVKDASGWVDGRSNETVRSYLHYWQDQGAIEAQGATVGKRFRFRQPFRDLWAGVDGTGKRR